MTDAPTPQALAERIKTSGIPIRRIADGVKMSENTVAKVASGSTAVRYETLLKVSEWLAGHEAKPSQPSNRAA